MNSDDGTDGMVTGQVNFGSHTDTVVEYAVDIVNVVTPGERRGQPYAPPAGPALRHALQQALPSSRGFVRPRDVDAMVSLGVAARAVFVEADRGRTDAAARSANGLLARYRPAPELQRHDGEPWHLHFHGEPASDPSGWGGGVAVALATVLGGEYADRLGVCAAPRCDRVFVDVSRNGTRRFCSTACQNRVKAAAHRARHADG